MSNNPQTDFDKVTPPPEPQHTFRLLTPDERMIDRIPADFGEEVAGTDTPPGVRDVSTGDVTADPDGVADGELQSEPVDMDSTFEVDFDGL